ncbi:hypothetical protein HKX48_008449 [Thoreauomyces humboldtii]|nr:hypothetical protein HKX48_008449 [Thoreauomyces humboldtii]
MTNTNTSQGPARRSTALPIGPASVSDTIVPTLASEAGAAAGMDSSAPSVRSKGGRNSPPNYLSDALEIPASGKDSTPHRRTPLFALLPSTAFGKASSGSPQTAEQPDSGVTGKADTQADAAGGPATTVAPKTLNLPTQWNARDKCTSLELSTGGQRVTYTGPGQLDTHAAAVRSNHPIPPQCGLFYYEVKIISKGRDGYIGIGLCTQGVLLTRLPGWEDHSWGYHGDDGHSFCCSGTGRAYGPVFTTGDVIGCVVNFMNKTISFTKNGVWLGPAVKNVAELSNPEKHLYPSVGLRTPGEIVEANFGQHKFRFDIDHHYKEEKARLWQEINAAPLPPISLPTVQEKGQSSGRINPLILSYLIHHGFCETAASFHASTASAAGEDGPALPQSQSQEADSFDKSDILQRQAIRNAILTGKLEEAVDLLDSHYPSIMQQNRHVAFQLKSQRFIELMRSINSTDEEGDAMELDEPRDPADKLRSAVQHGQDMHGEFGGVGNSQVQAALVETYSLLAYAEPSSSSVAYLLDPANRTLVADVVNRAILVSQKRPAVPAIETIYRQASVVVRELLNNGNGAAAFIRAKECLV